MLLAAGRGERMGALTAHRPKPLLEVAGKALIQWQVERLAAAGYRELVINVGYRGAQIEAALGDGAGFGVAIRYAHEPQRPLGTGRGVQNALPLLGDAPFLLVNADVWSDMPLEPLSRHRPDLAHLVLVPNPPENAAGDFSLQDGLVRNRGPGMLTYSGVALLDPALFDGVGAARFELAPLLRAAADAGRVTGERYDDLWIDVGTPQRLAAVRASLQPLAAGDRDRAR